MCKIHLLSGLFMMIVSACSHTPESEPNLNARLNEAEQNQYQQLVAQSRIDTQAQLNWAKSMGPVLDIINREQDPVLSSEEFTAVFESLKQFKGPSVAQGKLFDYVRTAYTKPGVPPDYGWNWADALAVRPGQY
ncbi:MAG: hypothetical protein EOP09_07065, partial [Proteobacteria bacterium]